MQPDEHLGAATLRVPLKAHRIVARLEDEKRCGVLRRQATDEIQHLPGGYVALILFETNASGVGRGDPTVALEGKPGDRLVGPPGLDELTG